MSIIRLLPAILWLFTLGNCRADPMGDSAPTNSEGMRLLQKQNQEIQAALEKIGEYGKQLDNGTLTWEEFQRLTEPLEKIVHRPTTFVIE